MAAVTGLAVGLERRRTDRTTLLRVAGDDEPSLRGLFTGAVMVATNDSEPVDRRVVAIRFLAHAPYDLSERSSASREPSARLTGFRLRGRHWAHQARRCGSGASAGDPRN